MDELYTTTEKRFCEKCGKNTIQDVTYLRLFDNGVEIPEGKQVSASLCHECDARFMKKAIERSSNLL
ncbi:MAG: hypothetical protein RDU59_12240 [Thermodesulfobacteriota bacterium]|nr:hypothetical protein [Thermodesulfobacteriota bacterium]